MILLHFICFGADRFFIILVIFKKYSMLKKLEKTEKNIYIFLKFDKSYKDKRGKFANQQIS